MLLRLPLAVCFAVTSLTSHAAAQSLQIVETEQTIAVTRAGKPVLTYNKVSPPAPAGIDPVYERSGCLHPVVSPHGRTVTAMFPIDHPHQHGIFSAWVKTTYRGRPIDFWNLAAGSGRVLHERVVSKTAQDAQATFEVDLIHRQETDPPVDLLRERWKITVDSSGADYHCFDLELTQTAITDEPLVVQEYHYGGLAVRGPVRWLSAEHRDVTGQPQVLREPSRFLNDLGSDRLQGNHEHARWVALSGLIDGKPATIAVLSHPDNFRSPQAARLHPTKPYFCFAPCVDGTFEIDRDHPYRAKYRFLVFDSDPDGEWIDEQWTEWTGQ